MKRDAQLCRSLARRESPELTALALRPRLVKSLPSLTGVEMTWGFAGNPLAGRPGTLPFCHFLRLPSVIIFSLVQRKQAQEDTGWAGPVSQPSIPDQELGCGNPGAGALGSQIPLWTAGDGTVLTVAEASHGASLSRDSVQVVPHCLPFVETKSSKGPWGRVCLSGQLRAVCGM